VLAVSVGCSNGTARVSARDGGGDARVYRDGGPPGSEDGGSSDGDTAGDAGREAGGPDVTEPPVALGPVSTGTDMIGATAADGTALLVVTAGRNSGPFSSAHYEPSSGWTPMTTSQLSTSGWGPITATALSMDAKGDAIFAWVAYEGSANGPKSVSGAARYDHLTGTWVSLGGPDCTNTEGVPPSVPVAVNASGDALLACEGTTVNHYSATTQTWSTETIDPAANGAAIFGLSLSDTGPAVAIYGQVYPSSLATRSADGTWTLSPASPACSQSGYYAAAIDAGGDLLLGLVSAGGSTLAGCYYAAATRTWTGPSSLGSFSPNSGGTLTAALTQTGDGVLVAGRPGLVVYPYVQSSGTWSSPAGLASVTGGVLALGPQGAGLAISGDGVDGGSTQELRVQSYSLTTGWGPASAPIGSSDTSFIALVSPTGTGWAAWIDGGNAFVDRVR